MHTLKYIPIKTLISFIVHIYNFIVMNLNWIYCTLLSKANYQYLIEFLIIFLGVKLYILFKNNKLEKQIWKHSSNNEDINISISYLSTIF